MRPHQFYRFVALNTYCVACDLFPLCNFNNLAYATYPVAQAKFFKKQEYIQSFFNNFISF